jgi:hypothetical protein
MPKKTVQRSEVQISNALEAPKINLESVQIIANASSSDFLDLVFRVYQHDVYDIVKRRVSAGIKTRTETSLLNSLGFGTPKTYEYVTGPTSRDNILAEIKDEAEKAIPEPIREISRLIPFSYHKLFDAGEETGRLIKDALVTLVDKEQGERHAVYRVPVVKRTGGILFSVDQIEAFEKTVDEYWEIAREKTHLMSTNAPSELIDLRVGYIFDLIEGYSVAIDQIARRLKPFPSQDRGVDREIVAGILQLNDSLEQIAQNPYSQKVGIMANSLRSAVKKINEPPHYRPGISDYISDLSSKVDRFHVTRYPSEHNYVRSIASSLGFSNDNGSGLRRQIPIDAGK